MHEDHNRRALPAAGEPEVPEPFHKEASTFGWPDLYTADQIRTYGDARAEHARVVAMEEAAPKYKQIAAYATLVRSMEARLSEAAKNRDAYDEAVRTLQSERDANAILTAEVEAIRAAQQGGPEAPDVPQREHIASTAVMQQALEALTEMATFFSPTAWGSSDNRRDALTSASAAISALAEALEKT